MSWHYDSVAINQTIVVTFLVTVNADVANGTKIQNFGVFTNTQEGTKNSNTTEVTVTALPKSNLEKAVRNVTTSTPATGYASTVDASPGDMIEYQLTYTNTGRARRRTS